MRDILLWVLIAVVGADLLANYAVWRTGRCAPEYVPAAPETAPAADPAPAAPVPEDGAAAEAERRSRSMEDGIENLMTYQVSLGRGRMSGGDV